MSKRAADDLHLLPARSRTDPAIRPTAGLEARRSRGRRGPLDEARGAAVSLCPVTADAMATTFRALADATRVRLLSALAESEHCVQALAEMVTMSESAVSHQLRVLRDARMVKARRAGRLVYYSLEDQHVHTLFQQVLTHVREPRAGGCR